MVKRAFTFLELLLVVTLITVLIAIIQPVYRRAAQKASIVAQFVEIRSQLDKALIRGALTPKTYELERQRLDRMFHIAMQRK